MKGCEQYERLRTKGVRRIPFWDEKKMRLKNLECSTDNHAHCISETTICTYNIIKTTIGRAL